ncbi:MAG: sigma-70 family RNA polymerase sigma factor [Bacteroides sp.]|nr:sigma-70 family RNA polymerase sigma factor [Bacteroides sp.]
MTHSDFHKLFDKTYMPLCMYALRIVGDTLLADEAVQQSFVAAWQHFGNSASVDNPKAYLFRIVRNEALRIAADASLSVPLDRYNDLEVSSETMDTAERDAALWNAIAALPPRCREVFLAAKRDGLTYNEIAAELKISVKTVENHMSKALSSLRDALRPYSYRRSRPFFLPFL